MVAKRGYVAWSDGQREFDATLDIVAVHTSTRLPSRRRRFFLGGTVTTKFGTPAAARRNAPPSAKVDEAFAKNDEVALVEVWDGNTELAGVTAGRIPGAIRVATPADKLSWAGAEVPPSTLKPGVYLTPPPLPVGARPIPSDLFGRHARVHEYHPSTQLRDGLNLALGKSARPASGASTDRPSRIPPFLSGFWFGPVAR